MVRVGRGSRAQARSGGCSDAIPAGPRACAGYVAVGFVFVIFSSVPARPLALVPLFVFFAVLSFITRQSSPIVPHLS